MLQKRLHLEPEEDNILFIKIHSAKKFTSGFPRKNNVVSTNEKINILNQLSSSRMYRFPKAINSQNCWKNRRLREAIRNISTVHRVTSASPSALEHPVNSTAFSSNFLSSLVLARSSWFLLILLNIIAMSSIFMLPVPLLTGDPR